MTWKSQIADGRVFQMRSTSKTKAPPCVLVVNALAGYSETFVREVDDRGVVDYDSRGRHPSCRVYGLRLRNFNSSRIARRREDLERFDAEDLALIRYGYALDFDGCISGREPSIPLACPAEWTVFWLAAYGDGEFLYPRNERRDVMAGAWWFSRHGGHHPGYKYGHCWATRHAGEKLEAVRASIRAEFPAVLELHSSVVRWTKDGVTYTTEVRDECPALWSHGTVMKGGGYEYTTEHIAPPEMIHVT